MASLSCTPGSCSGQVKIIFPFGEPGGTGFDYLYLEPERKKEFVFGSRARAR